MVVAFFSLNFVEHVTYEAEQGKRSKYEIVDMIEAQRELLLKEFSRMKDVGDS